MKQAHIKKEYGVSAMTGADSPAALPALRTGVRTG